MLIACVLKFFVLVFSGSRLQPRFVCVFAVQFCVVNIYLLSFAAPNRQVVVGCFCFRSPSYTACPLFRDPVGISSLIVQPTGSDFSLTAPNRNPYINFCKHFNYYFIFNLFSFSVIYIFI